MDDRQKRLEKLSPEKRHLALQKLKQRNPLTSAEPLARPLAIAPAPRTQPLPLSFSQRRLWFLDQFEPGTPAYNIPEFVRLRGPLEVAVLERALNEVIRRHEALRTTFAAQGGEPVQHITPRLELSLSVVDLGHFPAGEREVRCGELAIQTRDEPFDLATGPLLRVTLARLDSAEHVLLLVLHHIVSDGWSTGILLRELSTLYESFARGEPSPLPALDIQYADFAVWQQQWLRSEELAAQVDYWRQRLDPHGSALALPTDRPRPRIRTHAGGKCCFHVEPTVTEALRALATQEKASLYMVLLAAFQTLLHRSTHEPRISVGAYIANRNRAQVEPLIGFFLNTLVLRTDLSGTPPFRELLRRVKEVTLGAYGHQGVPFEKLLEELTPTRDTSTSPFFQVMLVLQNTPMPSGTPGGLSLEPFDVPGGSHAQFELTLWLSEEAGGLRGIWEYNRDLFDSSTMERMVGQYQTLLSGIVQAPDERISQLPLLPEPERRQLAAWSRTERAFSPVCLSHLIEEHAARSPEATAVIHAGRHLTYGELNRRANRLAHHLRALGVGPERLVAICLERSLELVIAVLAVFKAGGAYVPLDPSYPREHLASMLTDSRPHMLLTRHELLSSLPAALPPLWCMNQDIPDPSRGLETNPVGGAAPEHLAYVIYTSGSTGRPKGVMVTHRSLANAYFAWEQDYRLAELRTHLQMASFSFDVFAGDFARALGSGAAMVLCPREWLLEPERLHALMQHERVDCGEFVPAVSRVLMAHLRARGQRLEHMRLLIVGSDTWDMREYEQLRDLCGQDTRLVNSYGLSETTIDSTWWEASSPVSGDQVVPIGRPFLNAHLHLLDSTLSPVPIGVPGELYIGGPGVARGYWQQPHLTAERFVPDPFSHEPGARLFRTGDMARYQVDGTLAFLGRGDSQVKLRGHRIELGEIKTRLLEHAAVKEVELLVREENGDKQLVAYLILSESQAASTDALRQHLRDRLPPYMVPTAFVLLDAFPLTPNGKTDRRALPHPEVSQRVPREHFRAPRDELERRLAALWEELLATRPIGIDDDFFELGGHSLLAVRLMAKIHEQFGRTLPLATLFERSTLSRLALALQEAPGTKPWSPLVEMRAGENAPALFCMPGAGGSVLYFHPLARLLGATHSVYGLQARGLDGTSAPHGSIEEMAACYVEAIQRVQPRGPYCLLGHSFGSWVAFEMAQQLVRRGEVIGFLGIFNTSIPLMDGGAGEEPALDDAEWLATLGATIGRLFGTRLTLLAEALRLLPPDERYAYLTRRLVEADVLPPGTDSAQVRGLVQVYKANYHIDYFPRETRPVPITLFRALQGQEEDGVIPAAVRDDPTWGWNRYASHPVQVEDVPGDHLTMWTPPHVDALVQRLLQHLDRVREDSTR